MRTCAYLERKGHALGDAIATSHAVSLVVRRSLRCQPRAPAGCSRDRGADHGNGRVPGADVKPPHHRWTQGHGDVGRKTVPPHDLMSVYLRIFAQGRGEQRHRQALKHTPNKERNGDEPDLVHRIRQHEDDGCQDNEADHKCPLASPSIRPPARHDARCEPDTIDEKQGPLWTCEESACRCQAAPKSAYIP